MERRRWFINCPNYPMPRTLGASHLGGNPGISLRQAPPGPTSLTSTTRIKGTEYEELPLEAIIQKSSGVVQQRPQVWNHTFYWNCLKPNGGGEPTGALAEAINKSSVRWRRSGKNSPKVSVRYLRFRLGLAGQERGRFGGADEHQQRRYADDLRQDRAADLRCGNTPITLITATLVPSTSKRSGIWSTGTLSPASTD